MNPHSLQKRAARDLLIDTLFRNRDTGSKNYRLTYPFRDLEVIPEEPKVPYGRVGTVILKNSQAGIKYKLLEFPTEDEHPGSGNIIDGPFNGTGEDLYFTTPVLTERSHNFGIQGMKYAKGGSSKTEVFSTLLFQKVVIETGLNLDINLTLSESLIDYNSTNQVILSGAQQYVTYEVFAASDTEFSMVLGTDITGDGGTLILETLAFKEDTVLIVRATDQTPGSDLQATITPTVEVKVRPNPAPGISIQDPHIEYQTPGTIIIANSQASVNYAVQFISVDDDRLNAAEVFGDSAAEVVQGTDGRLVISTQNLTEDCVLRIMATKVDTRTETIVEGGGIMYETVSLELEGTLTQAVYPQTNVEVVADTHEVAVNGSTVIRITNPQRGVTYQLRNEVNNAKIGAPVFYNWDRGLDETTLNYDYVIGTHEGDQVTLPIGKISADKAFNILATKAKTGSSIQLDTKISITVK